MKKTSSTKTQKTKGSTAVEGKKKISKLTAKAPLKKANKNAFADEEDEFAMDDDLAMDDFANDNFDDDDDDYNRDDY